MVLEYGHPDYCVLLGNEVRGRVTHEMGRQNIMYVAGQRPTRYEQFPKFPPDSSRNCFADYYKVHDGPKVNAVRSRRTCIGTALFLYDAITTYFPTPGDSNSGC
jgi:hypothetical protein